MAVSTELSRPSWPGWRWGVTGLSVLGLALSAYLSWHYLSGRSVIGCGGGSPCDQVLNSRWSTIKGVLPVSGLAVGTYLALVVASFFVGPRTGTPDRRLAWGAMLVLSGAAAGSAVWFTIVQKWLIGAFCPYCMATHITGVLLAASVHWRALRSSDESAAGATVHPAPNAPVAARRLIGPVPVMGMATLGLALAGILAACQIIFAPPAAYRGGAAQATLPTVEARAVPLVGSADAPYIVTLLFDYKCPHCQHLHTLLEEVMHRYDGKVAFVLCPAPLNNHCNPYIAREVDEFKDSCELVKIGLAVWVADRKAFPAFDNWMFSPDPGADLWHPRSLDAAKAKAVELVGQAKFDAAQADPWIDRYLQTSVRIYGNTIGPDQSGNAVPKLVFGPRWVTPEPDNADDLIEILHASLGVPRP